MLFNITDGVAHSLTIILVIIMIIVGITGFTFFVLKWDQRNANLINNTTNISGIAYNTEEFNATNNTIHGIATISPALIWILIIIAIVGFLTLFAVGMRR